MGTKGIGAAIDDGLLNIEFRVQGFETVFFDNMGNAVPAVSNSASFTEQQRSMFRSLGRGKRFLYFPYKSRRPRRGGADARRLYGSDCQLMNGWK